MLRAAVFLALVAVAAAVAAPDPAAVKSAVKNAHAYFKATGLATNNNAWTRSTFWVGNTYAYKLLKDDTLLKDAVKWADTFQWRTNRYPTSFHADDECCGQTYCDLHLMGAATKEKLAPLAEVLGNQVKNVNNTDWWWVDAFFMGMPTFARLSSITGDAKYVNKMYKYYLDTSDLRGLWNKEYSLYYRDGNYFNKLSPNNKPILWSRGNGWAAAAFARTLPFLKDANMYNSVAFRLKQMLAALKKNQGADGMWRSNLADAAHIPNPETTGTSCFTFALAWAIRTGLVERSEYIDTLYKAWNGLQTVALQRNGLVGWCQPVAGSPGGTTANTTNDFCVGQFLMAGAEVYDLITA